MSATDDPDTWLTELRMLARGDLAEFGNEVHDLAATFLKLDKWLTEGGTLPSGWHLSTCMSYDCRRGEASD